VLIGDILNLATMAVLVHLNVGVKCIHVMSSNMYIYIPFKIYNPVHFNGIMQLRKQRPFVWLYTLM